MYILKNSGQCPQCVHQIQQRPEKCTKRLGTFVQAALLKTEDFQMNSAGF